MKSKCIRTGLALTVLLAASTAMAANSPIRTDREALRATLSGHIVGSSLTWHVVSLTQEARNAFKRGLDLLAAIHTPASLAALPQGVVLPCSSGTMHARMAPGWPRVLKLEWNDCAIDDFGFVRVTNGPGEAVFTGNSFAPPVLLSLRLGDRDRDTTVDMPGGDHSQSGGTRLRWNLRATGVLPIGARDYIYSDYLGKFAFETTGFFELTSYHADFPNPGPPYYPQVQTFVAQGLIASGEFSSDNIVLTRDTRALSGFLSWTIQSPTTPTRTGRTSTESYRFADLRTRNVLDYSGGVGRQSYSVDGRAQVNLAQTWRFPGCTLPETYTWKTRAPVSGELTGYDLYDRGEMVVNDKVTARFSQSGVEPYVDLLGHIDLNVKGVGTFRFSEEDWITDLTSEAGCAP